MMDFAVFDIKDIKILSADEFIKNVSLYIEKEYRVISYFGLKKDSQNIQLFISFLAPDKQIMVLSTIDKSMQTLSLNYPVLHIFEREIMESTGFVFENNPCPNPVRYAKENAAAIGNFFKINGEEINEVAVGPVHAGVIEPGHFRFQCFGENVFNLQIELGFQHRGIEKELIGGPDKRTEHFIETSAGDTTIAHSWTYHKLTEALTNKNVPDKALIIRAIALELERMANHIGDLGALSGDVAYLPTASYCGRIRGDVLNTTALICGNRFGRGLIAYGGVNYEIDDLKNEIMDRINSIYEDAKNAVSLLWKKRSVMDRFENTGIVTKKEALTLGLVGPAARACGVKYDLRSFFKLKPYENYEDDIEKLRLKGDVFSRAYIRWNEVKKSRNLIKNWLKLIGNEKLNLDNDIPQLRPNSFAIALTEGWRGEISHSCITDEKSKFLIYKIKDPSFNNWHGLSMALRNGQISDFPLCNKSFNLSYCGNDL
jgi:Ni,Fe-hydrogenase III large subunit